MRRLSLTALMLLASGLPVIATAEPAAALPTSVTLTTSSTTPQPHQTVTLTATANDDVTASGVSIQIWDTAKNALVAECTSGASCPKEVRLPAVKPLQHTYKAYLATPLVPGTPPTFPAAGSPSSSQVTVTWQRKWRKVTTATAPSARFGAHMAYHVAEDVIVLFGGCEEITPKTLWIKLEDDTIKSPQAGGICTPADELNDTWVFDASAETWSQVTPSGSVPHKRWLGSMTYDYTSDRVVLYGGLYQSNNGTAPTTDAEDCLQHGPTDYDVPGVAEVRENSSTGVQVEWSCFEDTWTLRKVSGSWTWEKLTTVGTPGPRFDSPMAYDGKGRPTLVGGCEAQGYLGAHGAPDVPTQWDCSGYPEVEAHFDPFPCVPGEVENFNTNAPQSNTFGYLLREPEKETCLEREVEHTDSWRLSWTGDPASSGTPMWTQVGCLEHEVTTDKQCAPPEIRGAAMTFDPATRKMVLYGGYYYEPRIYYRGFIGDTWEFDGDAWTKPVPEGGMDQWCTSRQAKKGWMAAAPVYTGTSWQTLNYGGYGHYGSPKPSCDTTNGDDRQDPWYPWPTGGERPGGNVTWGDTFRWDGSARAAAQCPVHQNMTICWYPVDDAVQLNTPGDHPGLRDSAVMAFDHTTGKAVMFGGKCSSCVAGTAPQVGMGDTWIYDGSSTSDPCGASCGTTYSTGGSWEEHEPALPVLSSPKAAWGAAVAEDPERGETVLFGGCLSSHYTCATVSDQMWVWDGTGWTEEHPLTRPAARFAAHLAWDDVDDRLILFGGRVEGPNGAVLSDTWAWDGANWSQLSPTNSPSGRFWHGMTTDSTGRPLLFGGCTFPSDSCSTSRETWRWNGSNWTKPCGTAVCSTSPSTRMVADSMASDSAGRTLLFGGYNGSWLSDSWAWDGNANTWTSMAPSAAPAARNGGAMTGVMVGTTPGVLLATGSNNTSGLLNDAWLFTFSSATSGVWVETVCDCPAPAPRTLAYMAPSPGDGRAVLFGGLGAGNTAQGNTWRF